MARRKSVCSKWTLVLLVVLVCPYVYSRPQETSQTSSASTAANNVTEKATEIPIRTTSPKEMKQTEPTTKPEQTKKPEEITTESVGTPNALRDVKTKTPLLGDSIKMVATQLLDTPSNKTAETPVVIDTRIPPKVKNQLAHKHKVKTRNEDEEAPVENSHAGVAVPVTMEELEKENKVTESSTSTEGISTWILLSNPANVTSTEPTKTEEPQKKTKPTSTKNKTKRPQPDKASSSKRPIIGSTNKSDLVAGGSAINENVYNKLKDTVLSNVQKNKNTSKRTTTTSTTSITTSSPTTEASTKKESTTKAPALVVLPIKNSSKPTKKKNKNKTKVSTTEAPVEEAESALLPMEPKEQEIELEISTPPTTTKKPKRSSTRKKNKTKKRKTKPKQETTTTLTEVKTSNKTKSTKTKKPSASSLMPQISSQIYNYFSREVMPSVGLGALGLASLVGIAGYFLPSFFATPVRRTFEVDKKDDIYKHNAEEYASEGNGQPEEEMLGTVLAGMPGHSKHKLNPYAGQTTHVNANRYPAKKEQDIRYRHVASNYDQNNYNMHFPQQKTGIAHGAVYPEPVNYNHQQYDTRHAYPTESKYVYDKGLNGYTPRPVAVEPIYAAPQTGPQSAPSGISGYGNDGSNSVVYGVKPSSESDFKPVYPFEGQFYSETTSSPMTYPPTSMYLGSNNEPEPAVEQKYDENSNGNEEASDNKFVVGNIPKELTESATPAVVPEHGPRSFTLNRKKRSPIHRKRNIVGSIEEILKAAKENKNDIFLSNEIDEALGLSVHHLEPTKETIQITNEVTSTPKTKEVFPVYASSVDPTEQEKVTTPETVTNTFKTEVVESVSTIPIDSSKQEKTTTSDPLNGLDITTKMFNVYEVFPSSAQADVNKQSSLLVDDTAQHETTTQLKNLNTETTTDSKSEITSTLPPLSSLVTDSRDLTTVSEESTPKPTNIPTEVLTYPPLNQEGGFFTFLKRLIEFKYRLGLSILQTTSENLNRYLRGMENSMQNAGRASKA